jgi:hypothetical protein
MALKNAFAGVICTAVLALGGAAVADQYRPDEFLGLDLSKALLSPKPLGPPTEFAPVPVEAKTDRAPESAQARAVPKAERQTVVRTTRTLPKVTQARAEPPRGAARAKLARRHGNPLDAQARDTRIQVWPCRSGGICNWQR